MEGEEGSGSFYLSPHIPNFQITQKSMVDGGGGGGLNNKMVICGEGREEK